MQVSLKWLRDYVDVDLSPEELAERLTMSGLEVDSLNRVEPAFRGVRVARIVSIKPHPHADQLSLCEVTTGDATYPVVCGAKNIHAGDIVPLAQVGAALPSGDLIRSVRIRDEVSAGMLCSEKELGIGGDASGIMLLPSDLPLGKGLAEALDLRDAVLDISVTPNRSDCLSIVGVAREVAAITGKTLRYPVAVVMENDEEVRGITSVSIEDPDLCPRYTARIIKNVRIGPSPFWMTRRLEAVGLRSINNIVDVTNFVMMELGQPLHAFDFRFLAEGRIVVRRSRAGETFVSLDGKERTLGADTLMICDGVKPVAIGGVMGGLNSEVKEETGTILLESAYFNPVSIRRTARALAMGTDAAFRFERGIDPEGVVRALDRAAGLMAELSGGTVCRGMIDQYPGTVATVRDIPLRVKRVGDILGTAVPEDVIVRILKSLEMEIDQDANGILRVTPPTCRVDIAREIDLIEEIVRLYGYDRVPPTLPAISVSAAGRTDEKRRTEARVREIMTGAGYTEVINYSFIPPVAVDQLGLDAADERRRHVRIRNPLSEEQAVMRTTMVYSLLRNAVRNADVGCFDLKIFETGRTFIAMGEGKQPREQNRAAFLITGRRYEERWHFSDLRADFHDLQGCVENILDLLRIPALSFRAGVHEPFLHPGKSCGVFSGEDQVGFLGEMHPDILSRMSLGDTLRQGVPVIVCEIDLDLLTAKYSAKTTFRAIPRFPSSSRDVAFLVRLGVEAGELLRTATDSAEELLEKVKIFDVYEGKNIPVGTRSLGLRFSYRSADRTLTDDEVNEVHARIVKKIVHASGASIR
ncbi:MAG: phenylalanine--tRNA ligase subunit beta [Syntrophobacterales bacterium CG_4_8_14_3_um_filter_58_8]|nr:MAG: phenylalanine--tRNA ligase subunit beta [Syntrophaceae bacterium CG2_30_58_14]PIV00108.1 MAG: phenylalanine--tRNA ligase subunit beta [Syntrophobacterales bacterium CG03_land_8_20_14_0_80_58_14]PJC72488.1 MAG: phenylalanine--tRNA ligase subunit beta [Syntrophobacterales bacterium CG_4_8_14_3_um_filter_58_8]